MQPNGKNAGHETIVKRASRRHDDHGHGGAWKVAFADFCLALLCLFLVMWLLASRNSDRMQEVLRSAGANLLEEGNGLTNSLASGSRGSMIERHPVPAHGEVQTQGASRYTSNDPANEGPQPKARYESASDMRELARLIERMGAEEGLGGNVSSAITPQGLRLMLHDTDARGMFERGSSAPTLRLRKLLNKLGPLFARIENQLLVVGHTDASQYSDKGPAAFSNWALSSHRAMAARFHLMEGGMPESSVLQVTGMADSAPLDPDHPIAAINRRIELVVLTSAQSRAVAAMYGAPRQSWPMTDGVRMDQPQAPRELQRDPAAP